MTIGPIMSAYPAVELGAAKNNKTKALFLPTMTLG